MSPRAVRRVVWLIVVAGIFGMIVASIADNSGAAITFGLIAGVASLCLILVTAVVGQAGYAGGRHERPVRDEDLARDVERQVEGLVAAGADEVTVRDLVRSAVRLGRHAERA
jgi:hypothetical protein